MILPFYDCLPESNGRQHELLEVDRVYRLDFDRFTKVDWDNLMDIYRSLPGWIPTDDLPRWFRRDEEQPPFLSASVEPPGLQVSGQLVRGEWEAWDRQFRASASALPQLPSVE
ncbi:MAG TPA: hypothetical protein RMG48_05005 [Myxococcales bacterium LLY-WYZ-16_1]|nr:hypothetical protein [Myxococcales bacterium LLY-WYZ-16_1]